MQNSPPTSTNHQFVDIITMAGQLIAESQQEKQERYLACGCPTCHNRAAEIEAWLNGDALSIPDEARLLVARSRSRPVGQGIAWLCMNCLHKVPRSSERCNHCNARRPNKAMK